MTQQRPRPNAVVTGASMGLGRALAEALASSGWQLTIDARQRDRLDDARRALSEQHDVQALVGDIADPEHRRRLVQAAAGRGRIDLIVNNASDLGGSPQPRLRDLELGAFERVFTVNVAAPQELVRESLPHLAAHAVIVNLSSDAAVEHYEGWGGYAATKAALDHLTLTWAVEEPQHTWYAVDPGDMRTAMHQAAFPGEDISDRAEPDSVAPTLVWLIHSGLASGRYRVHDLAARLDPPNAAREQTLEATAS